jgi:hypothetical protein
VGVIEVAKRLREGVIVTVFPDSGDRYLSTRLFEIAEELKSSKSCK